MSHQFRVKPATHFSGDENTILSTGDRILWRDPFGIGGVTIAATRRWNLSPHRLISHVTAADAVKALRGPRRYRARR